MEATQECRSCDLNTLPNRQGYLMLGKCSVIPTPVPELCPPGPADASFGIAPCRCVKSRWRLLKVTSGLIPLRPHDRVRISVRVKTICKL